jgi:hypothetical protein
MKSMPSPIPFVLAAALVCASCGQDPKLVEKREKQKAEIAALKGELALIEAKLKNLPPDVSDDLAAAKKEAAERSGEVRKLEAEVAALEDRKRSLQADYDAYRAKYRVN